MSLSRPTPAGLHADAGRRVPARVSPLLRCVGLVGDDMAGAEACLGELLGDTIPAVARVAQHLNRAGGKRIRPLLTALGARASGNHGDIHRLMCAGEVLHLGSLLHDDVVDGADARRGEPAAHRVYGNAGVILTGDVCLARAVRIAAEDGGPQAVIELSKVVTRMSEGEVLQLLNRGKLDLPRATYLDIIDRKSASLLSWCAAAGAWAHGNTSAAKALSRYGRAVGIGFQITDDVIDYIGDPNKTGKPLGQDLGERKLTLPLLLAMQLDPGLADALESGGPEDNPQLLQRVLDSGGPDEALELAQKHVYESIVALEQGLAPSPWRDSLADLAHHLVHRLS